MLSGVLGNKCRGFVVKRAQFHCFCQTCSHIQATKATILQLRESSIEKCWCQSVLRYATHLEYLNRSLGDTCQNFQPSRGLPILQLWLYIAIRDCISAKSGQILHCAVGIELSFILYHEIDFEQQLIKRHDKKIKLPVT